MSQTKIEWADKVWNPITGCSPVSKGCQNCYARRFAYRLKGRYGYPKNDPFKVTFHPDRLDEPLHWKKPSRIFVCSMGDLFHEDVKYTWIESIMETVIVETQHLFLFLTKRPQRMKDILETWKLWAKENLWLGVSVEDQPTADERIPILLQIPVAHRFVSVEPMLGSVDLHYWLPDLTARAMGAAINVDVRSSMIDWVIVGSETGPHARPLHPDWVRSLRDQCQAAGVPFFFKGWGEWQHDTQLEIKIIRDPNEPFRLIQFGIKNISHTVNLHTEGHEWPNGSWSLRVGKKKSGRLLDGQEWNEMPK